MYKEIIQFWFDDIQPSQWWMKNDEFDALITDRFLSLHGQAARCELFTWRSSPEGRLAEIIVLDQFSRNMFRGLPEAFTFDSLALTLAQEAVALGADLKLPMAQRSFIYMPYMHSESLVIHEVAENLFRDLGQESSLEYELKHKKIIERFNRYPHRNEILGRSSTLEELNFLQEPGSSF